MSKQRMINTKIWDDTYFTELKPTEKLLFIYLLSNTLTNLSGIYEIQLKRIAYDTGIGTQDIKKMLDKFTEDRKIFLYEGFIMIKNFIKNQNLNPSVIKGIERELKNIPINILSMFYSLNSENLTVYIQDVDSLSPACIQEGILNLTKPNLTKPNSAEGDFISKKEIETELNKFIIYRNNNFKERREITEDLFNAYKLIRKKYTKEQLGIGANKYFKDKKDSDKQYVISPIKFFSQKNGLASYL